MKVKKLTYKCPDCGRLPRKDYHGLMGLHTYSCCHRMGAKKTIDEAREAWNTLAVSAWQRKSTISAVAGPSDSPPSTVRG